ncbi:bark storage protein A-like [Gastrolobium bilobum]|uniref:bark storage protein A-like n=1 Tax=Gastrolobium bilobum TaxID=150636 RepID=UPI002AAF24C9|nr:bark storage protein A-like [Gastrolobium bilobum]
MGAARRVLNTLLAAFLWVNAQHAFVSGALTSELQSKIAKANQKGPYLGLVIPNSFELDPLLQNPSYTPSDTIIDFAGRRFRFGAIGDKRVVLVMTAQSMINAAITTQLLLSFFSVEGVVHYGIAGNANPSLHIGDVAIPHYWAHLALWTWQRYGQGPNDSLPLDNGGLTRKVEYLKFADFTSNASADSTFDNLLNNIWYQPEEILPIDGIPEERQHAFWVPVDSKYYHIARKLEGLKLDACVNSTTCLSTTPKVVLVDRGTSASIYLDNAAYRAFIYNKFHVSPVDMESASVALICLQQRVPFIAIRALSDLAGGGSAESNEVDTFLSLAATNSVKVVIEFVKLLSLHSKRWSM